MNKEFKKQEVGTTIVDEFKVREHKHTPDPALKFYNLRQLIAHLAGILLFKYLRFRYREPLKDFRPLAVHLEEDIFPLLLESKRKWLTLQVEGDGKELKLTGTDGRRAFEFPATRVVAEALLKNGLREIRFDTRLEQEQLIESLLLLLYVRPELDRTQTHERIRPGWRKSLVASQMLDGKGFHKFCALMRYYPAERKYEVEYTYCELVYSRVVRTYLNKKTEYQDHRELFSAAPRVAVMAFLVLALPVVLSPWNMEIGIVITLLASGLISAIVWYLIHTLGSMQYDKEHHDTLNQQYQRDIRLLSIFPESNPNLVMRIHLDGRVLYDNPAVRLKLNELELDETSVGEILPVDMKRLCELAQAQGLTYCEKEISRHGRTFYYRFNPFPDEESFLVSGSDVTYLKNIEQQLRELNLNLEKKVVERTDELNRTQDVTIQCMAGLAETRDPETGRHIDRTRTYVKLMAEQLREIAGYKDFLDDKTIQLLFKSAPLHDIGKVGVPDAILLKPGRLTPEEFEEIKKHPVYGGDALGVAEEQLGSDYFLSIARQIAYYHHERWDGRGYPFGLAGESIPYSARLMALADVYDALRSKRVYKEAYSHQETTEIIVEGKSRQFDPAVVEAYLKISVEFDRIAIKLSD